MSITSLFRSLDDLDGKVEPEVLADAFRKRDCRFLARVIKVLWLVLKPGNGIFDDSLSLFRSWEADLSPPLA